MSLDLNKLANKLDEALSSETSETLTKFLNDKTMSNNKQSMKLYTENQVRQMLEVCRDSDLYEHILTFEDILKTETPIGLPSDEEIDKTAVEFAKKYRATTYEISAFIIGAKYIIDKIQGGNK
jgi:hypothetical protein